MSTRPSHGWRRRFDARIFRWQARLDSESTDRIMPWAVAAVLFIVLLVLSTARARSLEAGTGLASAVQGAWLISHGHDPDLSISGSHLLAGHFPLGFYPLAWATRLVPAVPMLLAAQAAGIAAGVVPLWRMGRNVAGLRVGATAAVVFAYAVSPVLNDLNLNDFHAAAVATGPLLAAAYLALRERWFAFTIASVVAVLWSAELALVIAGIGVLMFMRGQQRVGIRIAVLGLAWTVIAIVWLEPRYGSAGFVAPGAFNEYGDTAPSVLGGMISHPFKVFGDLFAEENVRLLVSLFAPLLFLPILAPRFLLPALPLQALYLVADVPAHDKATTDLSLPLTVFTFVAAIFALQRVGRRSVERTLVDHRVLIALTVGALGVFAVEATNSPYNRPWNWGREDAADRARHHAADMVADDVAVRAAPSVLPLVADREFVYPLATGPDASAATRGVRVVVVDAHAVEWEPFEWFQFTAGMVTAGFRMSFQSEGITVYEETS